MYVFLTKSVTCRLAQTLDPHEEPDGGRGMFAIFCLKIKNTETATPVMLRTRAWGLGMDGHA